MNSLKDELRYLFSGQGMPYEKVAVMVAVVITVFMTVLLGNNFAKDAHIAVIDLDNSKYSHEIIDKLNASQYMKVTAVLNTPAEPKTLFYRDQNVAVVYLPRDLEKNRYTADAGSIGVFYDNTNTAQTADIKSALNELIAIDNQQAAGGAAQSGISLHERNLFNPAASTSNGETQGFLFFFSSMFFTFATIGMIPRLRLSGKLDRILEQGNPFDLMVRIVPYGGCLLTALFVGMAILRIWGDMVFFRSCTDISVHAVFLYFCAGHAESAHGLDSFQSGNRFEPDDSIHSRRLYPGRPYRPDTGAFRLGTDAVAYLSAHLGISSRAGYHYAWCRPDGYIQGVRCFPAVHWVCSGIVLLRILQGPRPSAACAG